MRTWLVHYISYTAILYHATVATSCENGAVRLEPFQDDMTPNKGYIQYCIADQWRYLCGSTFSRVEANVICRQLGYSDQGMMLNKLKRWIIIIIDKQTICTGATKSNKGMNVPPLEGDFFNFMSGSCAGRESALTECTGITLSTSCASNKGWINCTLRELLL